MPIVQTQLDRPAGPYMARLAEAVDRVALGREMADHLLARIPQLRDTVDDDFRLALVGSCTSNIAAILDGLAVGRPPDDATAPPDATAWAHELVHRGIGLVTLLRAYRVAHELLQDRFEDVSSSFAIDAAVRLRVLASASHWVFAYVDVVCTQLVDIYETERDVWLRGAAAAQSELVRRLVAGEDLDEQVAEELLRHPVTARQTAFLVWRDPGGAAQGGSPAATARRFAGHLGGLETLIVPVGDHAAWAWTSGPDLLDPPRRRPPEIDADVTIAVGASDSGVVGMRRSHEQARAARRVGEVLGLRGDVVLHFPALALDALLTADLDQARRFALERLGDLAADTDGAMRLRATLAVHLDERLSCTATGRRLGIHENTVRYRITRCEALLGRSVESGRLELEVALRLFGALPDLEAEGRRTSPTSPR